MAIRRTIDTLRTATKSLKEGGYSYPTESNHGISSLQLRKGPGLLLSLWFELPEEKSPYGETQSISVVDTPEGLYCDEYHYDENGMQIGDAKRIFTTDVNSDHRNSLLAALRVSCMLRGVLATVRENPNPPHSLNISGTEAL